MKALDELFKLGEDVSGVYDLEFKDGTIVRAEVGFTPGIGMWWFPIVAQSRSCSYAGDDWTQVAAATPVWTSSPIVPLGDVERSELRSLMAESVLDDYPAACAYLDRLLERGDARPATIVAWDDDGGRPTNPDLDASATHGMELAPAETFDPAVRAAEKQASRDADARALASGEKSRAQLKAENGAFAFPRTRIRFPKRERAKGNIMSEFKPRRCRECGDGTVCLQYQSTPLLVEPVAVPTCDHCGALWINPETAEAIDAASAESGGGLSGIDSDIHGEPETSLRELVSDDEFVRRQALIDAIGIAEFASAEWTTIVNHVRLMRENWDRFVADAASYKKRLDRELQVAQAESASWKQAHAELNADLQAKRNDLDFRRRQLCMATGVREDSAWEHALADVKEREARVTAAHEAGVKMWREIEPRRDMQLPPTRSDLVVWMLTRIEELEREHASEIANIKHAFAHIEIELRNELRAIRDALQARDDEPALDAAKRWVSTAMNETALLNDIDEARGMLCGELVMDDPGNNVEIMRQAALAIGRHRLSTEALNRIRAELAAVEAKSSSHGSGVTDHSQCGLGTIDDGPRDSDCPCRTSAALSACAAAGCGFCRAEIRMRVPTPRPRLSTETLNAQLRVLRNNWTNDPEIALQEVLTDVDELLAACSTRTTGRRDG